MPYGPLLAALAMLAGAPADNPMASADANHDGQVTEAEFVAAGRAYIMRGDRDHDGKVSSLEWAQEASRLTGVIATRGYPSMGGGGKDTAFSGADTNGDQQLSTDEIDAALRHRFEAIDRNHDGVLSGAELQEMMPDR